MKKTSSRMPAMGHGFGPDNTCACGKTWKQQRENPTVCPKLMAQLEELERMDRVLQQLSSRVRQLEAALAEAQAKEKKARRGKDAEGT